MSSTSQTDRSLTGTNKPDAGSRAALDADSRTSEAQGASIDSEANVRTFVLSQSMSWFNEDFNIYDISGSVAYVITNRVSGVTLTRQDLVIKEEPTGQTKLRVDAVE